MKANAFTAPPRVPGTVRLRRPQAGITLIELIAALAIIAMVIVGALALVKQADSGAQSGQMLRGLNGMRANVRALYLGQGTYGTDGTDLGETLINARQVPDDWAIITNGGKKTIVHNLKGAVTIKAFDAEGQNTFTVLLEGVPGPICQRLVLQSSSGWRQIKIDDTAVTLPLEPKDAPEKCGDDNSKAKKILFING